MEPIANVMHEDGRMDRMEKSGPCRETAATMLKGQIARLEQKLASKKVLMAMAEKLEVGSPAEVGLWEMFCSCRD